MAAKGRVPIIACLPDIFGGLERQWYQGCKELGCYAILLTDLDNISNLGIKVEDPNNLALLYCSPGLFSEGKYIGLHGNVIYGNSQSSKKGITESSMQTQDETQHENRTYISTDLMCFSALALGAPGIISGIATIVPQHCVEFYRTLAIEKDLVKARKQWKHLWELACFLQKVDYATGVAAALKITGIDIGPRPFPFKDKSLSEEELKALQQILQKFSKT